MKRNADFRKSFVYSGLDIYPFVEPFFNLTFNALFYMSADDLHITKKIIERHGGRIEVTNTSEGLKILIRIRSRLPE